MRIDIAINLWGSHRAGPRASNSTRNDNNCNGEVVFNIPLLLVALSSWRARAREFRTSFTTIFTSSIFQGFAAHSNAPSTARARNTNVRFDSASASLFIFTINVRLSTFSCELAFAVRLRFLSQKSKSPNGATEFARDETWNKWANWMLLPR